MSSRINICALLFVLTFLQFCTPVRVVSTKQKEEINLSSYKKFNFLDISVENEQMVNENREGVQMLKNAIVRELTQKGLKQSDNPDLRVNIGIVTENKIQTSKTNFREAPNYIGQRRYSWKSEEIEVARYKLGTVSVDIIDVEHNMLIWEGIVQGTLTNNSNKLKRRIDIGVEELLERFPGKVN